MCDKHPMSQWCVCLSSWASTSSCCTSHCLLSRHLQLRCCDHAAKSVTVTNGILSPTVGGSYASGAPYPPCTCPAAGHLCGAGLTVGPSRVSGSNQLTRVRRFQNALELGTRESERGTLPFVYVRMFCFFTIDVSNSEASEAREELGTLRGTIKGKRNQTGN